MIVRGDIVHIEIDVEMPVGHGFDAEQLTHMLMGRCHIYGCVPVAASSETRGIYNHEEEPSEDG